MSLAPEARGSRGGRNGDSKRRPKKAPSPPAPSGTATRRLAQQALVRIDRDGAYANLVLSGLLDGAQPPLNDRDRHFVTDLVYGATRMRRACDWYVDRFVATEPDVEARGFLRLGAYQLAFTDTPDYAAVNATVAATPVKIRGFVNAVLRQTLRSSTDWPSDGVRLSYPDWIVDRLVADLGREDALGAMQAMNDPAISHVRSDGYTQDLASQQVAESVGATMGERVLDLCAAPGGKATAMAQSGALVVAADLRRQRCGLIVENAERTGTTALVPVANADAAVLPFPSASFDRVLVDAPCSGLGSLRRRADARWRIDAAAVARLVTLQRVILDEAARVVRPGGVVTYSVCTLTSAETLGIDAWLTDHHPELQPTGAVEGPTPDWRAHGRGWLLLPQVAGTDGMFVAHYQRHGSAVR